MDDRAITFTGTCLLRQSFGGSNHGTSAEGQMIDRGREPKCAPDPNFPDGKDMDMSFGGEFCETKLPYPAKRCGIYAVECRALRDDGRRHDGGPPR